jgi:Protein of unknown function (DUF1566)
MKPNFLSPYSDPVARLLSPSGKAQIISAPSGVPFLFFALSLLTGCGSISAPYFSCCETGGSSPSVSPEAVAFTNQTGVALNIPVTSNAVTVTGFSGLLPVACNGCNGILRNGVLNGNVGVVTSGDMIALTMTSSSAPNTAVTATVTVGGMTTPPWSVTTSNNTPSPFSFTNQSFVDTSSTISSNTATLTGAFANATAICGTGCTAISRNGGPFTASPITGFNAGDTIAIQLVSSASASSIATASVTVGATTSATWSVTTTTDPCVGSPTIGTICADGSMYAGLSPDGNVPMYAARCDAGQSWNGSTCAGTAVTQNWSYGGTIVLGLTSNSTGRSNTATMYSDNGNADGPYQAASYCTTLSLGGHTDWYLPALGELEILYLNQGAIGGFNTSGTYYWSSTEDGEVSAGSQRFSDGSQSGFSKGNDQLVRCVRRN